MSLTLQSAAAAHFYSSTYSVPPVEYWNGKMVSHIQVSFSEYGNFFIDWFQSLIPIAMAAPVIENFPATFNLSDLNGANGFALNGVVSKSEAGTSVQGAGNWSQ